MYYVGLDIGNLSKWFMAAAPYAGGSGSAANDDFGAGYSVYFSDRRNNRNSLERRDRRIRVGGLRQPGQLDRHAERLAGSAGGRPEWQWHARSLRRRAELQRRLQLGGQCTAPLNTAARPTTLVTPQVAKANRPILFRRALKLANAATLVTTGIQGLTIASENPAYVAGKLERDLGDLDRCSRGDLDHRRRGHAAVSQLGRQRFVQQSLQCRRPAAICGFVLPGGDHCRQGPDLPAAVGRRRHIRDRRRRAQFSALPRGRLIRRRQPDQLPRVAGDVLLQPPGGRPVQVLRRRIVYSVPVRAYSFDTDFLDPSLLPPLTPVFRDLNTLGFSQEMRPGR